MACECEGCVECVTVYEGVDFGAVNNINEYLGNKTL